MKSWKLMRKKFVRELNCKLPEAFVVLQNKILIQLDYYLRTILRGKE